MAAGYLVQFGEGGMRKAVEMRDASDADLLLRCDKESGGTDVVTAGCRLSR